MNVFRVQITKVVCTFFVMKTDGSTERIRSYKKV